MKAVMISINKPHTDNIFDGIKYNEWRTKPLPLCKHYVYETKNKGGCGKVIGEMQIVKNIKVDVKTFCAYNNLSDELVLMGCVGEWFLWDYAKKHKTDYLYANIIENAKLYDKPKEISEFKGRKLVWRGMNHIRVFEEMEKPPQSWCYVEIEN